MSQEVFGLRQDVVQLQGYIEGCEQLTEMQPSRSTH
jgi:hypothetical protein